MQLSDLPIHEFTGHASDGYWRMPQYIIASSSAHVREVLKAHNYPHNGIHLEFQSLLDRISRSLPSYKNCTIAELHQFARQRRLAIADNPTHEDLSKALENADNKPRFPHFLDLPAELRVMIYRAYCGPFSSSPLTLPTWPPLARTSKHLRDELLPVFYSSCVFAVNLMTDPHHSPRRAHVLRMQRDTTLFYKSLQPAMMACVQRLDVTFNANNRGVQKSHDEFSMRIEVPRNRGKRVKVQITVLHEGDNITAFGIQHPWADDIMDAEWLDVLKGDVADFAERVRGREGGGNHLVIDDVYYLRSMLEWFFEDYLRQGDSN